MPTISDKLRVVATTEELERWFKFGDVSPEGIIYNMELAGPNGADYFIFPADHHTEEDIEATKTWMRDSFDVLSLITGVVDGDYPINRDPPEWTPEQREEGFRKIVREKSMGQVENCPVVDLFTASTVVQVMDGLSPKNKAKFLSINALAMIDLAWKLVERTNR